MYDAEERVFVRQLADWVSARAGVLEACAKGIPKFAADHFNEASLREASLRGQARLRERRPLEGDRLLACPSASASAFWG